MNTKWGILGSLIKDSRLKLELSQKDLAKFVNKDVTTISRWEKGQRRPKYNGLLLLSQILGIRIQILQSLAGYTPEFDWLISISKPISLNETDILLSASPEEKIKLSDYLLYLRFCEQVKKVGPNLKQFNF
jgi:transcriptional regulator with XRE-family HTH domain